MLKTAKRKAVLALLLILFGFCLGMFYTVALGIPKEIVIYPIKLVWIGKSLPQLSVSERAELEEQAIYIALNNATVNELVKGKQYHVTSVFQIKFRLNNDSWFQEEGENILMCEWDGKMRAVVTIIFADGSGYYVDVNLTDEKVEDIRYSSNLPH